MRNILDVARSGLTAALLFLFAPRRPQLRPVPVKARRR